jgi:FtsZ-binding cell division protein ZapB
MVAGASRRMIPDPIQIEEIHAHNEQLRLEHAEMFEQKQALREENERLQACIRRHDAHRLMGR